MKLVSALSAFSIFSTLFMPAVHADDFTKIGQQLNAEFSAMKNKQTAIDIARAADGTIYFLGVEKQTLVASVPHEQDGVVEWKTVDLSQTLINSGGATSLSADENGQIVLASEGGTQTFSSVQRDGTVALEVADETPMINVKMSEKKASPGMAAGFTAGYLTGLGFALRQTFDNGWGYQVGMGGISDKNSTNADLGIEIMKVLDQRQKIRFYAMAGATAFYSKNKYCEYKPTEPGVDPVPCVDRTEQKGSYNVGIGIGAEIRPAGFEENGFAFAVELPIWVALDHAEGKGVTFNAFHGIPIPSISIVYYFKH